MNFKDVVKVLKNFAPLKFAESWDNVGVLIQPPEMRLVAKLLLTNDLTLAVMDEAEKKEVDMILSYHPPIFKPLKTVTASHWKELIIGHCIAKGIAVYSPHTSYDALKGGVNDWLISAFGNETAKPIHATSEVGEWTHRIDMRQLPDSQFQAFSQMFCDRATVIRGSDNESLTTLYCPEDLLNDVVSCLLKCNPKPQFAISKCEKIPLQDHGMGRIMTLDTPLTLEKAIIATKKHLGLTHLRVAAKHGGTEDDLVRSVAVCAGSGVSVLRGVKADLFLTGEMSHHEVLEMTQGGSNVILVDHSNSERGFLSAVLQPKLTTAFSSVVKIIVSEADADPLKIM